MFDVISQVNWFAVLLATVASGALGAAYFVALVPRQYVVALGREGLPEVEAAPLTYVGPLVCGLVTVVAQAVLMAALGVDSLGDALVFGAIVGGGFLVPTTFTIAINPNFPRPLYYGLLNTPYLLLGSILTSVILHLVS